MKVSEAIPITNICPYCTGNMSPDFDIMSASACGILVFMKCDTCGSQSIKTWLTKDMLKRDIVLLKVNRELVKTIENEERKGEERIG